MYYIKSMINNLTEDDKVLLKAIYAPEIVAVQPSDASRNICVTPDGEIRIYGSVGKNGPDDSGTAVYLSSRDCGLSWKKHLVHTNKRLWAAGYNPKSGRYIEAYPNEFRKGGNRFFEEKGTWVLISDDGLDSEKIKAVKLTDLPIHVLKKPVYFETCKRWFLLGEYRQENNEKFPIVFTSDDDGESWKLKQLPHAPIFEVCPPHKDVRWQEYSCEPTIAELGDGKFMLIVRTSQDYHYIHYSYDNGNSWTEPTPSPFHGTITMPVLHNLSDGRIVFFWCNNQPMPELDHSLSVPQLSNDEKTGRWEDVFTNRDANHLAITEDKGESWIGFRELFLNAIRNNVDFRSIGGVDSRDKSVHQAEFVELPYNKLLVSFGQNLAARKVVILDIDWMYEKERKEDFKTGLSNISTQMYIKSNMGGYRGFSGHCAYNRTNGAILAQDPDNNFEEALQICRIEDERLVYKKQGAVWNFPASKTGRVAVKLRIEGSGVSLALTDHWYNPADETVKNEAFLSVDADENVISKGSWHVVEFLYNTEKMETKILIDGNLYQTIYSDIEAPNGLCYLHIQTLAEFEDFKGTYIKTLEKTV